MGTKPPALPDYGGRQVVNTTISIRNAGDGLSEGMQVNPEILELGTTRYVVLECVVHAHDHDRVIVKGIDQGTLTLDQVLKAGTATLIDADVVKAAIAEQAEQIKVAREKAEGVERLPFDDELMAAHLKGAHKAGLVAGCVECDKEAAAVTAEKAGGKSAAPRKATAKAGKPSSG